MHLQNVKRSAYRPSHRAKLLPPNQQAAGLAETLCPADVVGFQPEMVQEVSPCRFIIIEDVEPKKALSN